MRAQPTITEIGYTLRHLVNTTERFVWGSDAALCLITLTIIVFLAAACDLELLEVGGSGLLNHLRPYAAIECF